jgi:TonB family protein
MSAFLAKGGALARRVCTRRAAGLAASFGLHLLLIALALLARAPGPQYVVKRGEPLFVELPEIPGPAPAGDPAARAPAPPPRREPPATRPPSPAPRAAARPAPREPAPAVRPAPAPAPAPARPEPPVAREPVPREAPPPEPAPAIARVIPPPDPKGPDPAPPRPEAETPVAPAAPAARPSATPETPAPTPAPPTPTAVAPTPAPSVAPGPPGAGEGKAPAPTLEARVPPQDTPGSAGGPGGTGRGPGSVDIRSLRPGGGAGGRGTGRAGIEGEPVPLDTRDTRYSDYLDRVRRMIKAKWGYPCIKNANTRDCEYKTAQLVIEFGIAKDGRVPFVTVLRSSGYPIYDSYAVNAVKFASPFPPVPDSVSRAGFPIHAQFNYIVDTGLTNLLR